MNSIDDQTRNLIFQAIDQTISPDDFDRLQDLLQSEPDVREAYLQAVSLSESLRECSEADAANRGTSAGTLKQSISEEQWTGPVANSIRISATRYAIAALLLFAVCSVSWWMGRFSSATSLNPTVNLGEVDSQGRNTYSDTPVAQSIGASSKQNSTQAIEQTIAGHATIRRLVDLRWTNTDASFREGDVLPSGEFMFESGIAEIDFFCGANLIVEGPASLEIESDWSVRLSSGRLRANVPPAARGFVVKAADTEIVDLGTEFVLDATGDRALVGVIDGEVKIRGGAHDGQHLFTEQQKWLGIAPDNELSARSRLNGLSTANELRVRRDDAAKLRFDRWAAEAGKIAKDDRLIAYYPISDLSPGKVVRDVTTRDNAYRVDGNVRGVESSTNARDGFVVGPVQWSLGRFGEPSVGLEFDRPGARVRTRIDRDFSAFTFSSWVRIDELDHLYNALFMADGYENGEPHWQIRNDGRLMFSVMVDDSQPVMVNNRFDNTKVADAGLHRVYFTPPVWDISKSGHWMHLVAVYDPAKRMVTQYADGKQVSSEDIQDRFYIDKLQIGASEIGNWGQPFRSSSWFAVRNLNGCIDELAIYDAALDADEVERLYDSGKPLGHH